MRYNFFIALSFSMVLGGVYWYQSTAAICPVPLEYRLGELDPSFELTAAEARQHITAAEMVWEAEVGRDLFVYADSADFTIDFVFDERQASANEEESTRAELDAQRDRNDEIIATLEQLQREYESLTTGYEAMVTAYEANLAEYNAVVTRYNDRGGAPPDAFAELEESRTALNQEARTLEVTAAELNDLAGEINRLSERSNLLVNQYNREVQAYNDAYGFSREFTQGDYQGDRINIYTFSTRHELETVLAHEFGHALGIGHVDEPSALMYYLLEEPDEAPTLTAADVAAYVEVCGTEDSVGQKLRRIIRQIL